MSFKKLTPRILVRKDYGACFDFYTEKLGLIPTWGDRNGPYTSFALVEGEPNYFSMFSGEKMLEHKGYIPSENGASDTTKICLLTDDVQRDYLRLKAAGVEFLGAPQLMSWDAIHVFFRDPEGNLFELSNGDV